MRTLSLALLLAFAASAAYAQKWTDTATVSASAPLSSGHVCYTDGRDIACDASAPLLTGLGSGLGDRIVSGTLSMVATSATGIISLTTGVTNWGYLSSGVSYLPNLQTTSLSATIISATAIQLVSQTTGPVTCNSGNSGTLRYNSPTTTLQLCTGVGWQSMGVGIPAGAIEAFASTTCPTGWSEYTAARGRFLRGIDNGAGNDSDGTRAPGATQADMVGPHTHNINGANTAQFTGNNYAAGGVNLPTGTITSLANTGTETRPKNVAVTFCQFNGTSNGWNNPLSGGSTLPAGSTGDVQINSGGAFGADSGNFTYSTSILKAPNVTVSGNVSAATVTVSQNSTSCTSANAGTFRRNPTTNRVEICE